MRQTIPLRAYLDQRLVEAGALALRTLRRPGHFVLGKDEAAAPAAGGLDPDVLVGRPRRLEQVPEVVFDLFAGELQLVCDGRRRSGLAEHLLDLLAHGHVPSIVRDMTVAPLRPTGPSTLLSPSIPLH